ncbi:MAG: hypothetical protein ABJB47_08255 [Actinomycetota bacterium]
MTGATGATALSRLALRRDRVMLPAWVYVLTALAASTGYSFRSLYPDAAGRLAYATSAGHNPALLALYGGSLSGSSTGALTAWRIGGTAAAGAALMSIFAMIRHTRADEEAGRLELVGSAAVGRYAPLAAAAGLAIAANAVLAVALAAGLAGVGLPLAGALAFGLGAASCGLVFTAVAAVAAQLSSSARTARGIALGLLGPRTCWRAWLPPWERRVRSGSAGCPRLAGPARSGRSPASAGGSC